MRKLVTAEVSRNFPQEILSRITQLKTGNVGIGKYLQKSNIFKDVYNCKCGEFEIVQYSIKHSRRQTLERGVLLGVSPELDFALLLNTPRVLRAMDEYLS